jgi:hypothetical protein
LPLLSVVAVPTFGFAPVTVKVTTCPLPVVTLVRVAVRVTAVPTCAVDVAGASRRIGTAMVGAKEHVPSAFVTFATVRLCVA